MTIQRARELLGEEALNLSDEEITNLNLQTEKMCEALLTIIISSIKSSTKDPLTIRKEGS